MCIIGISSKQTLLSAMLPVWISRCKEIVNEEIVNELPLQVLEGFLDFASRLERGDRQRQTRRPAIVAIEIHSVLQAGDAVLAGDQPSGVGDAILPVAAGLLFAHTVSFPDGNGSVG